LKPGDTRASASISPDASVARSKADGLSSSGRMSRVMLTRPVPLVMITSWCNVACSCCSWRRTNSAAVLTKVLNAAVSSGFGFFLSRPMVQGPTSAGSAWPSGVIETAQPSSSSFLITRAVQPLSCHRRASRMASCSSAVSGVFIGRLCV
jgi:hypothetical protein